MENQERIILTELQASDLSFLLDLWHTPEVMRYADEFPGARGWTKADDPETAWASYRDKRAVLGRGYTQLILRLPDRTPVGGSFFAPLPEGYDFGRWEKPVDVTALMGDLKLLPEYWGRGLGTTAMRRVVAWFFDRTACDLLVVPPHRKNPAAQRVYEKAGFLLYTGMRSYRNHKIMTLTRARYEATKRPAAHGELDRL